MSLEAYKYGQVSPDENLKKEDAERVSKRIQKENVVHEQNLFQAEMSAEKVEYLLNEKQKKRNDFQQRLNIFDVAGGENRAKLKERMIEEINFQLQEINGLEGENFDRVRNKLNSILEYVSSI